jgi:hypothetical protein
MLNYNILLVNLNYISDLCHQRERERGFIFTKEIPSGESDDQFQPVKNEMFNNKDPCHIDVEKSSQRKIC